MSEIITSTKSIAPWTAQDTAVIVTTLAAVLAAAGTATAEIIKAVKN